VEYFAKNLPWCQVAFIQKCNNEKSKKRAMEIKVRKKISSHLPSLNFHPSTS
jgi:hypothetical protein